MKKLVLLTLVSFISCMQIHAQKTDSIQQDRKIGIKFQNLDNFGLIYKKKIDNRFLRIEALNLGSTISQTKISGRENFPRNDYQINLGFNIGLEKNHPLADRLRLIQGYTLVTGMAFEKEEASGNLSSKGFDANIGIGYILGINYSMSQKFELTAELIPDLRYRFVYSKDYQDTRIDNRYTHRLDLNVNNHARFSILYKF